MRPGAAPSARYVFCYFFRSMQPSGTTTAPASATPADIVFSCAHCAAALVVDAAAAGVTLPCQSCGEQTIVPAVSVEAAAGDALRLSDLLHQLKENESQRTEITGYINQLSIQLHRWQLRLKTLQERQKKLQSELGPMPVPPAA